MTISLYCTCFLSPAASPRTGEGKEEVAAGDRRAPGAAGSGQAEDRRTRDFHRQTPEGTGRHDAQVSTSFQNHLQLLCSMRVPF